MPLLKKDRKRKPTGDRTPQEPRSGRKSLKPIDADPHKYQSPHAHKEPPPGMYESFEGALANIVIISALLLTVTLAVEWSYPLSNSPKSVFSHMMRLPEFRNFVTLTLNTYDVGTHEAETFQYTQDMGDLVLNVSHCIMCWGPANISAGCAVPCSSEAKTASINLLTEQFPFHKMNAWINLHPVATNQLTQALQPQLETMRASWCLVSALIVACLGLNFMYMSQARRHGAVLNRMFATVYAVLCVGMALMITGIIKALTGHGNGLYRSIDNNPFLVSWHGPWTGMTVFFSSLGYAIWAMGLFRFWLVEMKETGPNSILPFSRPFDPDSRVTFVANAEGCLCLPGRCGGLKLDPGEIQEVPEQHQGMGLSQDTWDNFMQRLQDIQAKKAKSFDWCRWLFCCFCTNPLLLVLMLINSIFFNVCCRIKWSRLDPFQKELRKWLEDFNEVLEPLGIFVKTQCHLKTGAQGQWAAGTSLALLIFATDPKDIEMLKMECALQPGHSTNSFADSWWDTDMHFYRVV